MIKISLVFYLAQACILCLSMLTQLDLNVASMQKAQPESFSTFKFDFTFVQLGFSRVTDKKSSSLLIYFGKVTGIYTQRISMIKTK